MPIKHTATQARRHTGIPPVSIAYPALEILCLLLWVNPWGRSFWASPSSHAEFGVLGEKVISFRSLSFVNWSLLWLGHLVLGEHTFLLFNQENQHVFSESGFIVEKRGNIPVIHPDNFTDPLPLHTVDSTRWVLS